MKVETMKVTPAIAERWLTSNTHNRNIRLAAVNAYAADMEAGRWLPSGDAIRFAADGTLLDGQHRLLAIVQSGVTISAVVISGLAPETQEVMDGGTKRTLADVLALRGEVNTRQLAAGLRRITAYEVYGGDSASAWKAAPTAQQMLAALARHPETRDYARRASTLRLAGIPSSVGIYAMWRLNAIDAEDAEDFFYRVESGIGLEDNHPILALRRVLLGDVRQRHDNARMQCALIFKAWNKYRDGDPIQVLGWKSGGATPEAFPEPK
jgi:hypothetical protein